MTTFFARTKHEPDWHEISADGYAQMQSHMDWFPVRAEENELKLASIVRHESPAPMTNDH